MQRSHFSIAANQALAAATLCVLASLTGANAAEVPKKAPLTRYAELWTRSPFTTPPKKIEEAPAENPFDGLALRGIAPLSSGFYLITLVNKKNPTETTTIDTERFSDYEVVKIERDSEKALGTIVHLKKGSMTGTVSYDEKLSTLKPPPAPKGSHGNQPQVAGQPPMPPGAVPNMPGGAPQGRSRVVPPATPGTTPGAPSTGQPTTSGGPPAFNRFQPGGGQTGAPSTSGGSTSGRDSRSDRGSRPTRR